MKTKLITILLLLTLLFVPVSSVHAQSPDNDDVFIPVSYTHLTLPTSDLV